MSNCLFFSLWKWFTHGGHIRSRPSDWGWWRHYAWTPDDVTFYHYWPIEDKRKRRFPPVLFRGRVVITEQL